MIHYFGYYMKPDEMKRYAGNVPGRLKMEYVISSLVEACPSAKINVISLCGSATCFLLPSSCNIAPNTQLIHFMALNNSKKIWRGINKVLRYVQLFLYMLLFTKKEDKIIVYHSFWLTKFFSRFKRIFKRNYFIELEEIYGYSATGVLDFADVEISTLKKFNDFIVVNDTLPEVIGIERSNYCVCYGAYHAKKRPKSRFDDGCIHIVYAGTIEGKKCGVWTALEIAKYLDERYVLHIAGFGSQQMIDNLELKINDANRVNKSKTVFHGFLQGEELDNLLWGCHIGLSTYVISDLFSSCSFPSKLSSYTCHDLVVAVCNMSAYKRTKLNKNWILYDEYEPHLIAGLIQQYDGGFNFSNYSLISNLHADFVFWLKENLK